MPSFLNKVFGYKRHDDKEAVRPTREASDNTLLDGKYEAIPPIVSPSASTFAEAQPAKDPDRDVLFSLFRPRVRGSSQKPAKKHSGDAPHLTLQLPGTKGNSDSRTLGVVFEADPDSQIVLDDTVIAAKRLNPLEALILIRACAQTITERGLDTLGIMHPHWFSASSDVQCKLVSLFIRSLIQSRITTLSPTPTSSTSAFEDELHYTRLPHDVAAALRWGLRHLSLENGHFGKDNTDWGWYNTFFLAERDASYPPKGFSELLLPQLPTSHIELLTATLGMISSLASHAESNGISGSKLSKCLGLWLLVATRAEQSDDWNRFYARWERAGRILEHLFLARLREESFAQRLPTRLQELVKHYPYNNGSPVKDDKLLSRPRFSTRQYDALFVRVETLLTQSAEQPKLHPIQLLLDAFQLPVDNPSGDEHRALWNTLKTTVFEEATSSDPDGPQFARIFVDETIHLLSLIPADNSVPTSPTLLASPIAKVVSRKRSSSLTKAFEGAVCKSNGDNGSTPVSPTSPSSIVITDWAQFSLSGFGDTTTTQPLTALLSEDNDIEVTQPQISRKSSRQRGKSRSRRRRSEDRDPSDTPSPSQPDPQPSIVETKLASVHVVQVDEAFIDFWSDAIVDPISANWPTFVVCGLKQNSSAEQPIRWLVIEQAYSRQQPQSSRAPSPDGRRGRSPRPSFRSDISGFRINSVFSSARKRFSAFSKSATDLVPKKSPGGKTPAAAEFGEILVEEESTSPSAPPTLAGHHVDGNAAVRAIVISGATADVADQDEVSSAPNAGAPPVDIAPTSTAVMKVPSIEPTPQSGGGYNGSSVLPRSSVRESEEADSVRQDAPQTLEVVNPEINNLVDPITKISPLAADTSHLPSPQGACDPTVLASWPVSSAENPVVEEVRIQAAQVLQGVAVEAEDRPVELDTRPVDSDGPFHAQSTGEPSNIVQVDVADNNSQGTAEIVAIPPTPETVAFVAATLVAQPAVVAAADGEAPEPTVEGLHVAKQSSRKASADPVAAFTLESVGHHEIDDLSPVSANEVIASETGAHLEPPSVTSVLDVIEGEEVAELAEAPTQSPEHVAPVEETPDQEASVDVGRAGAAQVPVAKSEVLDGAALELEVLDGAASQAIAAELEAALKVEPSSVTHPVEEHSSEVVPAVATIAQIVVVETEHAADQVSELATEEARPHVEDTLIQAAEAPLVETCPVLEAEADVSPGTVSASQQIEDVALAEVETQAATETLVHEDCIVEIQDQGAPAPVPEHVVLVDETSDPEIATEVHETADVGPVITPEFKEVQDETRDPVVEAVVEAKTPPVVSVPLTEEAQPSSEAELPTQVHDTLDGVVLSTGSNAEVATAALATVDEEAIAAKADAQSTSDSPAGDAEAHAHVPENAPVEDTLEIATETSQPVEGVPSTATDQPIENKVAVAIAEEAQGFMREAEPPASEPVAIAPVAQDAQAPIEIEQPSSESVPQSVDEAASPPIVALSVPEEIINVQVEAQQEPEVVHPAADTFDGSLADHDAEPAPLAPELGVPVELTVDEEAANPPITSVSVPEETVTVQVEPEPEVVHPAVDTVDGSLVELAVDEEAANPPTVSVSVPQEVNAIQVEAQPEPEVVHPTVDTVDESLVDDAEPAPLAPELGVPVEETEVVVDTSEPETLAAEPEFVEVRAPIPVVEDVQAPVEAEESFPVVVEVSEEVVASQPEAPATNETTKVDEPDEVVYLADRPVTSEIEISTHEPAGPSEEIAPAKP